MSETTATAKTICSYCQKPLDQGYHVCGNTFVPPASLEIDPAAARLQEIRARAEREDYSCREHWAMFDADDDVLFLLDQLQSAHARAATLEQRLAQRTAERDEARANKDTYLLKAQLLHEEKEAAEARVRALEEHIDAVIVKWRERGHPPKPRGWMHRITIPEVLQCADELQAGIDECQASRRGATCR
jgi:chromosome segregation ATPase